MRRPGELGGGATTLSHIQAGRDVVITLARSNTASAFRGKIQSFLEEYLVSETGPVPFGGRDAELQRLDEWLEDGRAPPRLLITAPAGRGKSALLIRWIASLQTRDVIGETGWQLDFVPISIRVGTNVPSVFYQAIAKRLAEIARRPLETPASDLAAYYADQVRDLLNDLGASGTSVLVVLDGLDEALHGQFDAGIVPRTLPPSIRVLASARRQAGDIDSQGWLSRLGWDTGVRCAAFELDTLDDRGIADVLVRMGTPVDVIAKDPELVYRLAELTEREPLLLRFYAEDLWRIGEGGARITREELDGLKPGFGAYFSRWILQQKDLWKEEGQAIDERAVRAVLAVLGFAFGPMESDDLIQLTGHLQGAPCALAADELLDPLRRFVIGDGSRERGFVLSHPKIGNYFQNQYFPPSTGENTREAFADWGRRTIAALNNGSLPPEKAPPYLLQFFCEHLLTVDARPEDFMAMVENGWRLAWEHHEGGQQGFSSDVRAAWNQVKRCPFAENFSDQFRCALCLSSVRSLGRNVPIDLLVDVLAHRIISPGHALHLASFLVDPRQRAEVLAALVGTGKLDADARARSLAEALDAAQAIENEYARAEALTALAPHLDAVGLAEALDAAQAIENEYARAMALTALAPHLDVRARALSPRPWTPRWQSRTSIPAPRR